MSIDTYSFFLIVLSGFAMVWSFRHFSHSRNKISDFEYLGFSSFWGVLVLACYGWLTRNHPEQISVLVSNPFVAGVVLSLLGGLIGGFLGRLARLFSGQ